MHIATGRRVVLLPGMLVAFGASEGRSQETPAATSDGPPAALGPPPAACRPTTTEAHAGWSGAAGILRTVRGGERTRGPGRQASATARRLCRRPPVRRPRLRPVGRVRRRNQRALPPSSAGSSPSCCAGRSSPTRSASRHRRSRHPARVIRAPQATTRAAAGLATARRPATQPDHPAHAARPALPARRGPALVSDEVRLNRPARRARKSAHRFPPTGRDHPLPPRAARPRAPRSRPASGRVRADRIAARDPERRHGGEAQRSRQ